MLLQKLGIVFAKEFLERGRSALFQGVDSLDQAEDVGGHYQQVAEAAGAGVPVGVRRSAWDENSRTGACFDFVFAGLHAENAFEDVPSFVVVVVDMTRRDQARRIGRATSVLPFGDNERAIG